MTPIYFEQWLPKKQEERFDWSDYLWRLFGLLVVIYGSFSMGRSYEAFKMRQEIKKIGITLTNIMPEKPYYMKTNYAFSTGPAATNMIITNLQFEFSTSFEPIFLKPISPHKLFLRDCQELGLTPL